jgi:hypothetical protein
VNCKIRSLLRLIAIFALLPAGSGTVLYPGPTAQAVGDASLVLGDQHSRKAG